MPFYTTINVPLLISVIKCLYTKNCFSELFARLCFTLNANIAMKRHRGCKLMLGQLSCQAKEL